MEKQKFERVMEHIIRSIEESGYEPYDQIRAYLLTSDENYITRDGRAREYIQKLDRDQIKRYLKELYK